jgi:hypothetical protein
VEAGLFMAFWAAALLFLVAVLGRGGGTAGERQAGGEGAHGLTC